MGKVYNILLIDDEQSDIDLIESELSKLDIQVQIDIIQQEEQLIDLLENNPPDLVISDYSIPELTGINALQIVQDRHPQLPFILVAGSIGEEKAINIMLQGASNFAMKQNLDRLGPAILREYANYEDHKKKSRRLKKSRARHKNIVGSVNGIFWEADAETLEFLYVSPQSEKLLGYTPEEWLGEPNFWEEHIHPDDRKESVQFCHHKTLQGEDHSFEYRMIDVNDEIVWLRDYVTVVTENGEPNRLSGFLVDISKEKKAERQRDKAYEIANIGHWELDLINDELYWSNAVKKLHEVDPGYDPTLDTALDFYKEGEHRQIITTAVENAIETGESFEVELQIITSNDNEKWVRVVGETEFRNGKCIRIYGSTQDISERKVSEKKYRDIFNLSPQPMWMYDPKTLKFLDVNRAAINHYGFSYEEFMNMTLKDIRPEDDIPDLMEAVKEIRSKKDSYYEGLFRHKTKEEAIIHVNIKRNTIDYEGRKATMVLAEDVTEKLEAERQLQLSEQKFKSLVQSGASMITVLNEEGDFTYVSENYEQITGWSSQELIGKNAFGFMHPDDKDRVRKLFGKLQAEKQNQHSLPYRFKHKEGHWIWKESIGSNLSENTVLDGYVINSHDVTERKEYEEKLEELALVASKTTDVIFMTDPHEQITWVNNAFEKFSGYSFDEVIGKSPGNILTGPDNDQKTMRRISDAFKKQEALQVIVLNYSKTGDKYWFDLTLDPIFDDNGDCDGFIGIQKDVTDQIEHQQELRKSVERYEIVSKATSDTIWDHDLETDTIDYSQNIYSIFGYEQQQVHEIEDWWRNKIHPDDLPEVLETIDRALSSSSERFQMEYRFQVADGSYKYISDRAFIVKDQEGNPIRMIGAMRDRSEQKEAQRKMKKAFQERERILDRINEAFFAVDRNWNVTYWNKQAEEVIGVTRDDVLGKNLWEKFPEAKERKFFKEYERAFQEQVPVQFEEYYPPLDSWLELNAYPSEEGLSVFFRDITERKEAEQSLRELYQKNRLVLESTDEGIYGIDTEGRCTFINKAAGNMLGYRSEECIGKNMHDLIHHKHANGEPYPESECPILISKNKYENCRVTDEVFWRADGTCFNVEYTSNPMIEDGKIKGAVVAFSDITERKQHEKELQESLKEKETLLMEIHHRVKNNLAVVSGMMQMQVFEEEDENVKQKLSDGINRIQTMGGIHELLYQSESFSRIDVDKNIRKLVTDIVNTFEIAVELDIAFDLQKISLNINQAIPFSLIVNEVTTNVMKHAFIDRNQGTLSVSLTEEDNVISIHIVDNGQGLPDDFDSISNSNSLGLKLIKTLSTQLQGEYTYESLDEGTSFTFTFGKTDIKGVGNALLN